MDFIERLIQLKEQGVSKEQAQSDLIKEGVMFVDAKQAVDKVYNPKTEKKVKSIEVKDYRDGVQKRQVSYWPLIWIGISVLLLLLRVLLRYSN